jgi:DNA-binding transcriptional LysR family regulator
MDLAQLEAFVEVARRGRFRRAAEALFLTQPSLSARIHKLEGDLNVMLFHRLGRGVRLTDAGKAFLPYARRALGSLEQARDALEALQQVAGGTLRVGAARAMSAYVLPEILAQFRLEHPGIDVHIQTARSSEVLLMVVNEEVDVGLGRNLRHPDVAATLLYEEEVSLVTHPQHPFATAGQVSIYDVAREPLILYDRDSSFFQLIDRVCREAGIVPNVTMELDSIETTKRMIERGLGVSFLPVRGVAREVGEGTLTPVLLQDGHRATLPAAAMVRRARLYSPAVLAFLGVLEKMYGVKIDAQLAPPSQDGAEEPP